MVTGGYLITGNAISTTRISTVNIIQIFFADKVRIKTLSIYVPYIIEQSLKPDLILRNV